MVEMRDTILVKMLWLLLIWFCIGFMEVSSFHVIDLKLDTAPSITPWRHCAANDCSSVGDTAPNWWSVVTLHPLGGV